MCVDSTFGRLVDLENFDLILRMLSQETVVSVIRRLGILNIINPMKPSLYYQLSMRNYDERYVVVVHSVSVAWQG